MKKLILGFVICLCMPIIAVAKSSLDIEATIDMYSEYDYSDSQWITDEDFFGKWNQTTDEWEKLPYLNYSKADGLAEAEQYVKLGDYDRAKDIVTEYYRVKFLNQPRSFTSSNDKTVTLKAQLNCYNIFMNNAVPYEIVEFGENPATETADVTNAVASLVSKTDKMLAFGTIAILRDDYSIFVKSKESGNAPYIIADVNGVSRRFDVYSDFYIRGGSFADGSFGTEENIVTKENTDPSETMRSFMIFDLSSLTAGDIVTSATLYMQGYTDSQEGNKQMLIFTDAAVSDGEASAWNNTSRVITSFNGEQTPYMRKENFSGTTLSPFEDYISLVQVYRYTGNEIYAWHAFRLYKSFIQYYGKDAVASRTLDLATRSREMPEVLAYLASSEHFTAENFIPILKYVWTRADGLVSKWGTNEDSSNWGVYNASGLAALMLNFDEFYDVDKPLADGGFGRGKLGGWRAVTQYRFEFLSGELIAGDGSITESAGYIRDVVKQFLAFSDLAAEAGVKADIGENVRNNLIAYGYFLMNSTGPNFCDMQIGDSYNHGSNKYRSVIKMIADATDEPVLKWVGTDGEYGTAPDNKSTVYPEARKFFLKNGWTPESTYISFVSDAGLGIVHNHADDLSVNLFSGNKFLLVDPLFYSYSQDDPVRAWLISTRGHNTIEVNGLSHKQNISAISDKKITAPDGTTLQFNRSQEEGASTIKQSELYDSYDYAEMSAPNYLDYNMNAEKLADAEITRSLLFLKDSNFVIVSDYIDAKDDTENSYAQCWHMLPDADISLDEDGICKSNYVDENICVIPLLDNNTVAKIEQGLYSVTKGSWENADYLRYEKSCVGDTSYNTVLLPTKGENNTEASVERNILGIDEASGVSMRITREDKALNQTFVADYYKLYDTRYKETRKFGSYMTDGELAFAEKLGKNYSQIFLHGASLLADTSSKKVIFRSDTQIKNIFIAYKADEVKIETECDIAENDITFYCGSKVTKVTVNGKEIPFKCEGKYIYTGEKPLIEADSEEPKPESPSSGGSQRAAAAGGHSVNGKSTGSVASGVGISGNTQSENPLLSELDGRWSKSEIEPLIKSNIVKGDSSGKLLLDNSVTRAEFVSLLVRVLKINGDGEADFADVSANDWFYPDVAAAYTDSLISGYDGLFYPNNPISREETAKILMNALNTANVNCSSPCTAEFRDMDKASEWAVPYIEKIAEYGIMNGYDNGNFEPHSSITREQAFVVMARLGKLLSI